MKKLCSILLCFLLATAAFAFGKSLRIDSTSSEDSFSKYPHAVGMHWVAAPDTIPGLHYQQWINSFGYSFTFGGYYRPATRYVDDDTYTTSYDADLNAWVAMQYAVYTSDKVNSRLYLWGTAGFLLHKDSWEAGDPHLNGAVGFGIGFEPVAYSHISLPLEFGYIATGPTDFLMSFTTTFAIRYRF